MASTTCSLYAAFCEYSVGLVAVAFTLARTICSGAAAGRRKVGVQVEGVRADA